MFCTPDSFDLATALGKAAFNSFDYSNSMRQVRELVKKITDLEGQRDALERQLAASPQQGPVPKEGGNTSGVASDMPLQDQLLFKVSSHNDNNVIVARHKCKYEQP